MRKQYFYMIITTYFIFASSLFGITLKQSVQSALNSNPIVKERLKNYRATQQDLNIAESEYYPSLDVRATGAYNSAGNYNDDVTDEDYTNYETSVTLTQNLFDGFGTVNKVDYQEARILAAAYNYQEKLNDLAYKMTTVYVNVLKSHELVQTARENVQINEAIYKTVKGLYASGLTTESEMRKIQSSLSLARSNLIVQKNNARDTEYNYRRILGRLPDVSKMQKPDVKIAMPKSIERAAMYAINNNPSIMVSNYNIKGAQSLLKQKKKEYYPKVDLEISQFYNDVSESNSFDSVDDRFRARLVFTYNLFRGGADKAEVQKNISKINQEVEIKRDLKRQTIESLDLSWDAYKMLSLQLKDLKEFKDFSEKTLVLYREEYDLGRRTLLDLLSAQNDVIKARNQIITAQYDYLLSKYRILDAMGLLVQYVTGDANKFVKDVNLNTNKPAHEILDELPVKFDVDNDNINDNQDLCDNSAKDDNIMPYGCAKIKKDSDNDGVIDSLDQCALTPKGTKVYLNGCEIDSDRDGIVDSQDTCPYTPKGYNVDNTGCPVSLTLDVKFKDSTTLAKENFEVEKFAEFLKANKNYTAHIIGYSFEKAYKNVNDQLSLNKANAVERFLRVKKVHKDRLTTEGRGDAHPLFDDPKANEMDYSNKISIELIKE